MNSTTGHRVSHLTLIPLFLIVLGIFVWGMQYKLSLYDAPGSPSPSVAQAKLLSPNERPDSLRTITQLRPQFLPSSPLLAPLFLIASICLGILPVRMVRASMSASRNARHTSLCFSSFFFFRPPPASSLAH